MSTYKDVVKSTFAKYKGSGKTATQIMRMASQEWNNTKKGGGLPNDIEDVDPNVYGGKFSKKRYVKVSESPVNARPVQLGAETRFPKYDTSDFVSPMAKVKLEKIERPYNVADSVQERQMFGGARRAQPSTAYKTGYRVIDGINDTQTGRYNNTTPASMMGAGFFDDIGDFFSNNADWIVPTAIALL
jgi:hypothetical protein